jgi:phage gp46-like protein
MDPVMNFPGGYVLDDSGNLKKWRTAKEKLRQRLMNRLVMRRGMAAIPGYEEEGSRLYTLNRVKPSQRSVKAREYVDEALQPEIEIGEISRVVDVMLNESESGKYRLVVSVELPDGEILDLEVSGTYGG